ncbi:MAG TPA: hypothetical protein VFO16_14055 [Pseudonocardiaceae bacterium]|nr:hypothetical protein [Pseudonocardiaceae bacterium]
MARSPTRRPPGHRPPDPPEPVPAWVPCLGGCGEFWCTIHRAHVHDCDCPGIEVWARRGLSPYDEGGDEAGWREAGYGGRKDVH